MQRVYKYPTGAEIPSGSIFLSTQVETETTIVSRIDDDGSSATREIKRNPLVWHYFLTPVDSSV